MGSRPEDSPPAQPLAEPGPVVSTLDIKDLTVAAPSRPPPSANPPRLAIIGAGSRGQAYAHAVARATAGRIVAVAEPHPYKRAQLGRNHIWGPDGRDGPADGEAFASWTEFVDHERDRRRRAAEGEEGLAPGVDGVFVCVLDEMHRDVVVALASLPGGVHIMCEKPLATSLAHCVEMYRALRANRDARGERCVFSIGHVLRYSPHNVELRRLLLEERVIGDVLSVVHTEPVGWWHFTHSYVRGNWRREDTTAPSLLTKSCHDVDVLLWLLCSPARYDGEEQALPHLPSTVSSSGRLQYFKKSRKPTGAGAATNCLSCPVEASCKYSAKRIYTGAKPFMGLDAGITAWPVSIVLPEIEDLGAGERGRAALLEKLAEDYGPDVPAAEVAKRNWFGRCVYESDNDVVDEQVVTITWDDDALPTRECSSSSSSSGDDGGPMADSMGGRGAKQATFHMVAQTKRQCERHTRIYGVGGEIYADSYTITVEDFNTGKTTTHTPPMESAGHGGGDLGLTRQFVEAIDLVKNRRDEGWTSERAQREVIRCTLDETIRSHAMVFCAEEARRGKKVVDWAEWWAREVEGQLEAK